MAQEEQPKKIIVDEDWKKEAQRDKEVLAAQEAEENKETAKSPKREGPLPEGNLLDLIRMLTSQALFGLGFLQIKGEEEHEPDLDLAKYYIELLQVLEEKTKGNLTADEQKLLKNTLAELRMGYVSVANQASAPK